MTRPANLFIIVLKCVSWMSNKKSSLPPSLFPFVLHPSIPVLSWAWPRLHSPLVLGGHVRKNKPSDWKRPGAESDKRWSWREKCRCVCCCYLTLCTGYGQRDAEHTHAHTLSSTDREDRSLCVWLWPRKWQECGGTVSELWEVCMPVQPYRHKEASHCGGTLYIVPYM